MALQATASSGASKRTGMRAPTASESRTTNALASKRQSVKA